jgi:ACS family tartrate transporter-like MFS transporter
MVVSVDISTRAIRKLRNRIIPLLFILFIVAYVDRINIGFAALTMNAELAITSEQFGLLTGIFFGGYFLFEIPSNLLLHKIGARVWIARILVSWGIVAVLTGFVQNAPQLYAARFLLGVGEAGFLPGVVLYLSYWFPQREQAQVLALFMIAIPVASIVGAPLSGFLLDHVHWLAISSWRWLLILEGLPAIVGGVATYFLLPSRPAEAKFLTDDEKDWLTSELRCEEQEKINAHSITAWRALAHPRVWHLASVHFAYAIGFYGMIFYLPQAMKILSNGFSNAAVGVMVMVPHLAGLAALIPVSRSSDRRLERRYHAAIPLIVGGAAMMLLGTTGSLWLSLMLWSLAAMGLYAYLAPFWSLPNEFLTGYGSASGIALLNSIANLGGFIGSYAIGASASGAGGLSRALAVAGIPLFVSASLLLLLPMKSTKRLTMA